MEKKIQAQMNYFTREAVHGLLLSKGRSIVSISTIGFALFIFGIYLLIAQNVQTYINKWQEEIHVEVFLSDELSLKETEAIAGKIENRPGIICPITYISQSEALEKFKQQGFEKFFDGLTHNPLPASFQITLHPDKRSIEEIQQMSGELLEIPGIDDVTSGIDLVGKLEIVSHFIRMAGLFTGLLILVASVFIISNTIKLSLFTRIDEIDIMKLVGATNSFVMIPYLLEGIIQGLAGALSSIILIFIGHQVFLTQIRVDEVIVLGFSSISFISVQQCLQLVFIGVAIGLTGSYISVKHFLNPKFSRRL